MKKILIIDDEPAIIMIVKEVLESKGYLLTTALDGSEAMKILNQEQHDLVIVDYQLPYVNGVEVIQMMKANTMHSITPIILCTGNDGDMGNVHKVANVTILKKPFEIEELAIQVKKLLEKEPSHVI
ncbi:hypothetical protein BHU72_04015 [Desulfuribacillus stibiiarsenatis]|uniref:Response regulatory domain-containing protein n=1 Tax=Desulfuribacillus stibiiarsenatis TaxID=1390249 RepID=A0A1E5L579_9FIRM|nr:response regulator [Desulfuribacillus stibiiarsenatis]OEH85270.1 hypothetical protein BHU72_04015 [Desulfuribacillus stibiiarsenatis]